MDGTWGDGMTDTHDPAGGPRLIVLEDADAVADHTTAHIVKRLKSKPGLVLGLPPDHPASYHAYMREMLFRHIDIDPMRAHLPDGLAHDATAEGLRYEQAIAEAGGIDLMVLGIGGNGHISFNEPGSPFTSRTRPVRLTEATRAAALHGPQSPKCPASALRRHPAVTVVCDGAASGG